MKIITGILSNSETAEQAVRTTYFDHLPNPIFIRTKGGASPKPGRQAIVLDGEDDPVLGWSSLWNLCEHLVREEDFDFFLKIPGDCHVNAEELRSFFRDLQRERPSLTHYMGPRILRSTVREVSLQKGTKSDKAEEKGNGAPPNYAYCDARSGFLLSRRAMELIVEKGRGPFVAQDEWPGDQCLGQFLAAHRFYPTLIRPGIIQAGLTSAEKPGSGRNSTEGVKSKVLLLAERKRVAGWKTVILPNASPARLSLQSGEVGLVFTQGIVERLGPENLWNFLHECARVISAGGVLRINMPSVLRRAERSWPEDFCLQGANSSKTTILRALSHPAGGFACGPETVEAILRALGFRTDCYPVGVSRWGEIREVEKKLSSSQRSETIAIEAVRSLIAHADMGSVVQPQKVAFLFLTRGEPRHGLLWQEYFQGHEGEFSIYLHAKQPHSLTNRFWQHAQIPEYISTQWGGVSLVTATLALLSHALRDPRNTKFVLVSESCVPIKPFAIARETLLADGLGRMFWETPEIVALRDKSKADRLKSARDLPREHWFHHEQWLALNRETAGALVDNDRTSFFEEVFASDESYVASTLSALKFDLPRQFHRAHLTYVDWERSRTHAHPYEFEILTAADVEAFRQSTCLFARKFSLKSNIRGVGLHLP
jgi:hypothetical protein